MKKVLCAAGLLVALAACHYAGNGVMTSSTGMGQAQFTFDINCPPGQHQATGTLTYLDQPAGVSIRGVPGLQFYFLGASCDSNGTGKSAATFTGQYQATNGTGTGTFSVTVTPPSDPNQVNGGMFELTLTGGPYDGYHNTGPVTGHIRAIGGADA